MDNELRLIKDRLRHNERIWAGFRRVELRLIAAHSLREMASIVVQGLTRDFTRVDCVTLACVDPEYEIARLVEGNAASGAGVPALEPGIVSLQPGQLEVLFRHPWHPYLGPADPAVQKLLFPAHRNPLGSVALAPLVRHGRLIGCLSQGSADRRHFSPDTATDLLEHLAAVTALCIENAISHERLKLDGLTDPLTSVANRRFFDRRLREEIERWRRSHAPLSALLVDVDHFKRVNDQFGHRIGDQVLCHVARELGAELRASDVLARYGGEEFVMLLPQTPGGQAHGIAERLRARIESHAYRRDRQPPVPVTVSIGLSCLEARTPVTDRAGEWLMEEADRALYEAKRLGRNRVVFPTSIGGPIPA
jgi:diguanylate cyclase (GGDEF)-like protein